MVMFGTSMAAGDMEVAGEDRRAAEAVAAAVRNGQGNPATKAEPGRAVSRMLSAQIVVAGLLFAALSFSPPAAAAELLPYESAAKQCAEAFAMYPDEEVVGFVWVDSETYSCVANVAAARAECDGWPEGIVVIASVAKVVKCDALADVANSWEADTERAFEGDKLDEVIELLRQIQETLEHIRYGR